MYSFLLYQANCIFKELKLSDDSPFALEIKMEATCGKHNFYNALVQIFHKIYTQYYNKGLMVSFY